MTGEIDRFYGIFQQHPKPLKIHGSPLASGINIFQAATWHPLPEILHEYLSAYIARAMTTIGNAGDFRHFLPRIHRELLANNFDREIDPEPEEDLPT